MEAENVIQKTVSPEYVVSAAGLIDLDVNEIPMLIGDLIPLVALWAIVGASDTGKSMILRQLALCVAAGKDFLGRECKVKNTSAIYVSSEDDSLAIAYLLKKQNREMNLQREELSNLRFIFDTGDLHKKLDDELTREHADIVVIDAFGDVFDGKDLNQNNQVRAFLNTFSALATRHKCSIGFLHHTSKRSEELAPSKNNSIGSQAFEAKMRLVMELRQDFAEPEKKHLCIVKGNYLPVSAKQSSYVLAMSENLVFSDTGSRTAFDQLVKPKSEGGESKKRLPYDISDEDHEAFLLDAYRVKGTTYTLRGLREVIQRRFGVGDQKAREFIKFYSERKWIVDKSQVKSRNEFHINTFGMKKML